MNLLRYWFPSLGGQKQCITCGFPCIKEIRGSGGDSLFDYSIAYLELTNSDREQLPFGPDIVHGESPHPFEYACYRGVWDYSENDANGIAAILAKKRRCKLFFPHQRGGDPQFHLNLKHQVANRWWTFWAVLGATGIGGSISGVVVWLLQRGGTP